MKNYIKKDLANLSVNLKETLRSLFTPINVVWADIFDYFFLMFKTILIVMFLIVVIGLVQKPGHDANTQYVLEANHAQMLEDGGQ